MQNAMELGDNSWVGGAGTGVSTQLTESEFVSILAYLLSSVQTEAFAGNKALSSNT